MIKLLSILMLSAASLQAAWISKLDLSPTVTPIVLREIHDGQWLAGVAKADLWQLERNGVKIMHAGLFHAWNAEKGNASFGPILGVEVPVKLSAALGNLGASLGLVELFKPAQYLASIFSIDAFAGYRPVHTADVNGEFTYGIGARLNIAFGVKELAKGL